MRHRLPSSKFVLFWPPRFAFVVKCFRLYIKRLLVSVRLLLLRGTGAVSGEKVSCLLQQMSAEVSERIQSLSYSRASNDFCRCNGRAGVEVTPLKCSQDAGRL